MSAPLLHLLAARGRTGALLAATALATTGLVGGGAVVLQSVSSASAAPNAAAPEVPGSNGRGAERRSDKAKAAGSGKKDRVAAVPFTCDPSKSHGQNVSAYVHSLPQGPGRGRLVSEVAQSDCGKTAGEEDDPAADAQGIAPQAKKSTPDEPGNAPDEPAPADPGKAPADPGTAPVDPGKSGEAGDPAAGKTPAKDKPAKAGKTPAPR